MYYVKKHKQSYRYLDQGAIGPVQDYVSAGEEEDIFKLQSKLRIHFGSNNLRVSARNEPRYTPSPSTQELLADHFKNIMALPQLPANIGVSGFISRYRGVSLLEPRRQVQRPASGGFIPRTGRTYNPDKGIMDHFSEQFQNAVHLYNTHQRAHICQGIVRYWDEQGVLYNFPDPDQELEQKILQVLSAHGAAQVLEYANLTDFGFSKEQVKLILGPPSGWVLQSTW